MLAPCDSEQSSRTPDCRDGREAVDELAYWVGFNKVLGIGPARLRVLLDFFGGIEAAWLSGGALARRIQQEDA